MYMQYIWLYGRDWIYMVCANVKKKNSNASKGFGEQEANVS